MDTENDIFLDKLKEFSHNTQNHAVLQQSEITSEPNNLEDKLQSSSLMESDLLLNTESNLPLHMHTEGPEDSSLNLESDYATLHQVEPVQEHTEMLSDSNSQNHAVLQQSEITSEPNNLEDKLQSSSLMESNLLLNTESDLPLHMQTEGPEDSSLNLESDEVEPVRECTEILSDSIILMSPVCAKV